MPKVHNQGWEVVALCGTMLSTFSPHGFPTTPRLRCPTTSQESPKDALLFGGST